ncbi:MAG TPA: bacteriohopanetetrol glucosamine biosynthesis glycosyltransferase HpnI [Candidatus Sulfotelmatobacter sp.]|nr:bacteriohopanetetrol glucosamine biosynthesis glycosyltransferase HpnI [Candidatus Sulfotelmatobacter sp.]
MIHITARVFQVAGVLGCVSSSIYYLICLRSATVFIRQRKAGESARPIPSSALPPVSILKPLKGNDPDIYESFRSHCLQDYPEYEIVFGVSDPDDPAVASVQQLQQEFPQRKIRLVVASEKLGANVKVSNLEQMVPTASYQYLLVNDSDIRVEADYLRRVIALLVDERVGMVTCLYRGVAAPTMGSQLEALGISTDFCAGVLVARQLEGGLRFGLGSTLAFRRTELEKIGGFRAIVDFLADDYELGHRIADLGLRVQLCDAVVETHLPAYDLRGFLAHQLRWARGVQDARTAGYIGLAATFGLMWGLITLIATSGARWAWAVLGITVLLRFAVAVAVGRVLLGDRQVVRQLWLLPFRDLIAVAVWIASFAGHTVTWRGDRFELKNGKLTRTAQG